VIAPFTFDREAPYRAGARRGVDFAASPGAIVGSACAGVVRWAGRVPGGARGVTIRCGRVLATHLGLRDTVVRSGMVVAAGTRLGRTGGSGVVRLGARRDGERHGYVDPATLLGAAPAAPPIGSAPHTVRRGRRLPPRPRARRLGAVRDAPPQAPGVLDSPPGWAGAALAGSAIGAGGIVRRRRGRPRTEAAIA
jgi:hypothetical protein